MNAREWLNGQLLYVGNENMLCEPGTMPDDHAIGITIGSLCRMLEAYSSRFSAQGQEGLAQEIYEAISRETEAIVAEKKFYTYETPDAETKLRMVTVIQGVLSSAQGQAAGEAKVTGEMWYKREEIIQALRNMSYAEPHCQELADWFLRHIRLAFDKDKQFAASAPEGQGERGELYQAYLMGCEDECLPEPLTEEQFLSKFCPRSAQEKAWCIKPCSEQLNSILHEPADWILTDGEMALYFSTAELEKLAKGHLQIVPLAAPHPSTGTGEPDGHAYRYPDGIRFNAGIEVNACKPIEAVPYYFGKPALHPSTGTGEPDKGEVRACPNCGFSCPVIDMAIVLGRQK